MKEDIYKLHSQTHVLEQVLPSYQTDQSLTIDLDHNQLSYMHLSEQQMDLLNRVFRGDGKGLFNHIGSHIKLLLGVIESSFLDGLVIKG